MKQYIFKIFYICISLLLFCGCGNILKGGGTREKKEDNTEKESIKDQETLEALRSEDKKMENQGENASILSADAYKEIGFRNPPEAEERGENFCSAFLNAKGMLEMITFSPWMDTGGEMLFSYVFSEDGMVWDRQPLFWTEGLKGKIQQNRISIVFGQDQNYYAYYCDEEQLYHMVKNEGDSFFEIEIKDWEKGENKYPKIPGKVAVLACGNIVMADTIGNCFVYCPDGSKVLANFRCGWCETLSVSGNDIFILDDKNMSVLHYDGKALEMRASFEGNFSSIARLSVFEDTLYLCSPEGIFSVKPTDKENTSFFKWLEAGNFHFSKENGYPLDFFSLGENFYLVYAEEWGRFKKYVPKKEGEEFLNTLTIYSLEKSELLIDMIAEFKMQYPQIDVRYEMGEGGEGSTLVSDYIRALNTRILAGDGPDILILDGLPAQSYMKKGILADLSGALSNVLGKLQENIVSNYRQGNQIYMLPLRYTIPMIATSGQNAQIFNSLSDLVAYCEEGEGNKVIAPGVPYPYVLELLYFNFPPQIISENGSVNKENLLDFIRLTKRFCQIERAVTSEEFAGEFFKFQAKNKVRNYFSGSTLSGYGYGMQKLSFVNMAGIYSLSIYPQLVEQNGGALLGNKGIFFPNGVISVNAHAKEKELAYQFIEAAFSYEMQRIHSSNAGFSVYEEVLIEDASVDRSDMLLSSGGKTLQYFSRKDAKQMIRIAKVVQIPVEHNQPVFQIIQDAVCACLRGEKSEEEAVKEVVERVQLYYFE